MYTAGMMQSVAAAAPLASRREPKAREREKERKKDGRAKEKKKEEEREREKEGERGGRICTVGTSYNAQWRETGTWKGFK